MLQLATQSIRCSRRQWKGRFDWYTDIANIAYILLECCISQLFSDIRFSTGSVVNLLSHHKQQDGPFDAPEITRQATLTHILMLQVYNIQYTARKLHITAFQWYNILKRKLNWPLIISQTAGWSISCTADHQMGRPSANVSNKKESKHWPTSARVRIM